ncbi:unnamed protein product [Coregonus sp. 'balchen']|nr:unnamed protein product [Coregonus sp. 'balchen']
MTTMLLRALGALLCSLVVTAEVMPQGDFNLQGESGWNNENDMRVVDVKYDEYALIHTIKTKGGVSTVLNKLYDECPAA